MDFFRRGDIHPTEETMVNEFKGHRSFCMDEIPRLALSGIDNPGNRPSRRPISKYACGMLNTGKGGTIFMGILDNGRIDGFMMSKYQQDHVRLSIQDTFDRYTPVVPPHLYKINFKPVIDNEDPEIELKNIYDYYAQEDGQDRQLNHLLQSSDHCWCDANCNAQFARGFLNPFFVVELKLQPWNPEDPLNKGLFEDLSKPKFKAEDGIPYIRKFGSNHVMTD